MGQWRCSGSEQTVVLSPGAVLTEHRNFKRTGYTDLVVECLANPARKVLGRDGDIDLHTLFANQTRDFPKLPRNGRELLSQKYYSVPVEL